MMVVDGRISPPEKLIIYELLQKVGVPWTQEQVAQRVETFIDDVKREGYQVVLQRAKEQCRNFKECGKEELLLRCLGSVAKADGQIRDVQKQLYNMFRSALESYSR